MKKTTLKFVLLFLAYLVCVQVLLIRASVAGSLSPSHVVSASVLAVLGGLAVLMVLFVRTLKQSARTTQRAMPIQEPVGVQTFDNVWYSPEKKWYDLRLLAYTDIGRLTIGKDSIEFQGGRQNLLIQGVRRITYGKHGRDFINNWVGIEYVDGATSSTALFADGAMRGWGGVAGGTKQIFDAAKHLASAP